MKQLILKEGSIEDIEILALLNKQLIEDEGHDNKMDLIQLKERMKEFINSEYRAVLFIEEDNIKGYALLNVKLNPVYLRQFFICRECRREGYGTLAFQKLIEYLGTSRIDIEVLSWNERAINFWRSLGFMERSIYMRLER
ncbi:GNAT family N-acetyltransferase [Cohnella caldifontis]|uniref:GNAT family N-acetyltransferase n=1 Tax=Cohnella caldifontis TaxID=3027471 RepID=UPI0023ED5DB4|nr:GNAT family N-acetyltransferase [Cohnella sp. YIM B05605]